MNKKKSDFEPGTLWHNLINATEHALSTKALMPIATENVIFEDNGVRYLVRVLVNLHKKIDAGRAQLKKSIETGQYHNPFLPYEDDLYVTDLTDTHLIILNKFSMIDHHILIITREFEEQESVLNADDHEALWMSMNEFDGFAFYNSGRAAGSSQRHKHLQMIPLPLTDEFDGIPTAPLFAEAVFDGDIGTVPGFPFKHAIAKVKPEWMKSRELGRTEPTALFQQMIDQVCINSDSDSGEPELIPYSFLATREWMLVVPRTQVNFEMMFIAALGFAGIFMVRNEELLQRLIEVGPMNILKSVSFEL